MDFSKFHKGQSRMMFGHAVETAAELEPHDKTLKALLDDLIDGRQSFSAAETRLLAKATFLARAMISAVRSGIASEGDNS